MLFNSPSSAADATNSLRQVCGGFCGAIFTAADTILLDQNTINNRRNYTCQEITKPYMKNAG